MGTSSSDAYWKTNIRIVLVLLSIWFLVSYVFGILLFEVLNTIKVGGTGLGFWFAQQGSIYVFIVLILAYALWMDRVDRRHGVHDEPTDPFARARARVAELLAAYERPALSANVERELYAIVERQAKQVGLEQLPGV